MIVEKPRFPFFEELDHTADVGIRAYGTDLSTLFVNAARGMMSTILAGIPEVGHGDQHRIAVHATSMEDLLRDWLAELLFLHATKRVFPIWYKVQTASATVFEALVYVIPMSEYMNSVATEIKAVTWHALSVRETADGYEATVIFDT